jgi:hypothetical protein
MYEMKSTNYESHCVIISIPQLFIRSLSFKYSVRHFVSKRKNLHLLWDSVLSRLHRTALVFLYRGEGFWGGTSR